MALMGEIRRRVRHVAGPVVMAGIAAYFGYHAVEGDRGLISWWQVTSQIKSADATLERVRNQRTALERRVTLLGSEKLDLDLLDERAHLMLNMGSPDEVVVLNPYGDEGEEPENAQ